jgi:large subunit ribosomal protein L13
MNKTYTPTPKQVERPWYVVDASGQRLGRLASELARLLRGKDNPEFATHMDTGAFVVVVNADKVAVTGKKRYQKLYRRHSGRPGGMKVETFEQLKNRIPERIIQQAVKGMLPKNSLGRQMLKKLKIYAGPEHPHAAQKPQKIDLQTIPKGGEQWQ